MSNAVPIFLALALSFGAPLLSLAALPAATTEEGPVLVVGAPWRDLTELVRASGARPIGPVQAPFAVLADADAGARERLASSHTWAVLPARALAKLCGA
ncbi:hypothetical protein SAMN05421688_1428 [Poseidonocella pacifica]|uniref:Uncharacterized protein n=2 Tax=Poseidonocella pacifica TaxID=871651 RepID=A0A1I0WHC5_9RHOB|nr:hypothetical protein SAMN05421688_1428 [Poseidonocella pacifica]